MPIVFALSVHFKGPLAGLPAWAVIGAGLACVVLALALLAYLHRAEAKLVSRRTAWLLVGLRLAAIAAILAALLYDPVLIATKTETVPGTVIVAVDRSDSMRVAEPHRLLAEKLSLALSLKLHEGIATTATVNGWILMAKDGGTPKFAGPMDPEKAAFEKLVAAVDGLTRLAATRRILAADGLDLLGRLRAKNAVDFVGFGSELLPLPGDAAGLAAALPDGALSADAVPQLTNLSLPLARPATLTAPALGVVLFADGRHTWGDNPDARLADLVARGVPVYPVVTASANPPADVAILLAQAHANTVFKGSVVPVDVQVRVTGWPAGIVRVSITPPPDANGQPRPPITDIIGHSGADATYPVTLKVKLDTAGPHSLVVKAEGEGPADRLPTNNQRTCRVTVIKDRAKVLLLDGEARWEFHYLHTCLGRDPNMDVSSFVFRQPRIGAVAEAEIKTLGLPSLALPDNPDLLSTYDCIILGDVELQQMTPVWRERIEQYVSEIGGTIVIVAGKRAMPREYASLTNDAIRRLLPIQKPTVVDSENGFPLSLTADGQRAWFLSLADNAAGNQEQWANFPPHFWAIVGSPKPGAEVLATVPGPDGAQAPAVVRQNYGFGRVLSLGIDSTWRWRYKAGDQFHHRFWGQVVQWAASDRLLPAVNAAGTIRFGPREPATRGGQDVEIAVRTSETVKPPKGMKTATVIRLPDKPGEKESIATVSPLTVPEGKPRELMTKLRGLAPGRYAVELSVPEWDAELRGSPGADGKVPPLRAPLEIVPPDYAELVDLTPNMDWLQKAARETGGKVHTVDTLDELVESLSAKLATRDAVDERPWRRSWWLFGLVVGLLAVEWIVRKATGLV
jgi:hypothetical protein